MLAAQKIDAHHTDIQEDVTREAIVSAFRTAMVGHFRSHVPGTIINESTLLASDYLNHFQELVRLFEALDAKPQGNTEEILSWRPLTYEEHFSKSSSQDREFAIVAYRRAPAEIKDCFDDAIARLQGEALTLLANVGANLSSGGDLDTSCLDAATRMRGLIEEATTIANGSTTAERSEAKAKTGGKAAIAALFGAR